MPKDNMFCLEPIINPLALELSAHSTLQKTEFKLQPITVCILG